MVRKASILDPLLPGPRALRALAILRDKYLICTIDDIRHLRYEQFRRLVSQYGSGFGRKTYNEIVRAVEQSGFQMATGPEPIKQWAVDMRVVFDNRPGVITRIRLPEGRHLFGLVHVKFDDGQFPKTVMVHPYSIRQEKEPVSES